MTLWPWAELGARVEHVAWLRKELKQRDVRKESLYLVDLVFDPTNRLPILQTR